MTASDVRFILATFKMNQVSLAKALSVSLATVGRWASGQNVPTGLHAQVLRAIHHVAVKVKDDEVRQQRIAGVLEMGIGSVVFLQLAQWMP